MEDEHDDLVHSEYFILNKKQKDEELKVSFIIPIYADPFPEQYFVVAFSDRCVVVSTDVIIRQKYSQHSESDLFSLSLFRCAR